MKRERWYTPWLTPIGAMVVLLVLNLGVTTWLAFDAQRQRQHTDVQVVEHRIRNEEVHQQQVALIECFNLVDRPTSVFSTEQDKKHRAELEKCRDLYDFNHQKVPQEYRR